MSKLKFSCTCLLALVLLFPAISAHDDAISLSAFRSTGVPSDDSLSAARHTPESDDDSVLATLLDRLEALHVGSICILHVDVSSTPFHRIEFARGSNRSVSAPVGRAPPIV
jgi:hypothetical protein